jgi:hypothetical protein
LQGGASDGRTRYFFMPKLPKPKAFKILCEFFYSRIDKNRRNSTLGIPETLQVEKF